MAGSAVSPVVDDSLVEVRHLVVAGLGDHRALIVGHQGNLTVHTCNEILALPLVARRPGHARAPRDRLSRLRDRKSAALDLEKPGRRGER